ncbi:MAG: hypothetical protein J1G01_05750 [Clostridiales bacterium]|nr:hypothetical protein [Clostridiales bacterium]
MEQFFMDWGGHILSAIAIIFTAITFFLSLKANRLQNRVNELDAKIKKYELDKIQKEKEEEKTFELGATIVKIGKRFRLRVYNIGKRTAYNVSARIEGDNIMLSTGKMPFDELEPQRNFEETLLFYDKAPRKFRVIITWQDENQQEYNRTQMCSV